MFGAAPHLAEFSTASRTFDPLVRPQPGRYRSELQQRLVFVDGRAA